jgi:hypothetical protein
MQNFFLKQLSLLLGKSINPNINPYQFANDFNIHKTTLDGWYGNSNFVVNHNGQYCPPYPFLCCGKSPKMIGTMSLNPGITNNLSQEKIDSLTPPTWDQYCDGYYTDPKSSNHNFLRGSFYSTRVPVWKAILQRKNYIAWGAMNRATRFNKLYTFLDNEGLISSDLVPFHSKIFSLNDVNSLYKAIPSYKDYHENIIFGYLGLNGFKKKPIVDDEGIIFVDGQASAKAILKILNNHNIGAFNHFDANNQLQVAGFNNLTKLSYCKINNRRVILVHEFLRRQGGIYNTNADISRLINFINTLP